MKKKIIGFLLSLSFFLILSAGFVQAQALGNFKNALPIANETAVGSGIKNSSEVQELEVYIQSLTNVALSLIGVIFFILTVYGGYKWMIARGDAKEVETAKNTIIRAVIGLVVVILAYAISSFVIEAMVKISVGTT